MSKKELIKKLDEAGLTEYKIMTYGNIFKVTIDWRDYLKVRHLIFEGVEFVF